MRKPFYRKAYKCWYVKDKAGKFIRLHPDHDKAESMYADILAARCDRGRFATVQGITEAFLQEHEPLLSKHAFYQCFNYGLAFVDSLPSGTLVSSVSKGKLATWLQEPKPGRLRKDGTRGPSKPWSKYGQRDAGQVVKRIFRWARNEGMIERDPIADMKFETPAPRQTIVTPDVHNLLVQACLASKSKSFALYLIASHCGARPQQIREVTVANVSGGSVWIFEQHKTAKRTGKPLKVYLSPCLQTLTRILATARPEGPLFRNDQGGQWKKDTVCQRFKRLQESLGLESGLIAYAYRHTFVTDSLRAGNDIAVVAALAGHASTQMVQRVYNHLDQHPQHLIDAAARTSGVRIISASSPNKIYDALTPQPRDFERSPYFLPTISSNRSNQSG